MPREDNCFTCIFSDGVECIKLDIGLELDDNQICQEYIGKGSNLYNRLLKNLTLYTQTELNKAVQDEREVWIVNMLKLRDLAIRGDIDDVYHYIYRLANPMFNKTVPWQEWEAIRARNK